MSQSCLLLGANHAQTQILAMAGYSCRLCQGAVLAKHTVGIFSPTVAKQHVSTRIEDHLSVEVLQNDGLPLHIYQRRLETLERGTGTSQCS